MLRRISIVIILLAVGIFAADNATTNLDCTLKNLPSLKYGSTSCRLNDAAKEHLGKIAQLFRDANKSGSTCKIAIVGNPVVGDESQEKVNCRLGVMQRHLMNTEGIDPQRLIIEATGTAKDEDLFEFKAR